MIYGIGADLLNSNRIKNLILKYDEKFINRFFGINEINLSKSKFNKELFFSKRLSAKVSVWKAFSSNRNKTFFFKRYRNFI